jgi:gamma-glutamylcyclotransferase (GGCT)/AIG2-like uncharacterized protein YtfP
MTDRHLPFFVYGTLRAGERNHRLLRGRTLSWTPAELHGALLFLGPGYPFAVVDPAGSGVVRGDLVRIAEQEYGQVLADLDRLESYVPGAPGNLYERVARTVGGKQGETQAWVYLAGGPLAEELLASGLRIPGGDWRHRAPAGPSH